MECAARDVGFPRDYLISLDECLERTGPKHTTLERCFQQWKWRSAKEAGEKLIKAELEGSDKVFMSPLLKRRLRSIVWGVYSIFLSLGKRCGRRKERRRGRIGRGL